MTATEPTDKTILGIRRYHTKGVYLLQSIFYDH
jgi:hypothetical protein